MLIILDDYPYVDDWRMIIHMLNINGRLSRIIIHVVDWQKIIHMLIILDDYPYVDDWRTIIHMLKINVRLSWLIINM